MAGKLIALESTNQQLLDKTARYLALALQAEGKQVEVLEFPQKQSSGHFVQSHQSGEYGSVNPYAASMFYILDRYDAAPRIRQYIAQDIIVICKSYRGTTLAKLGAQISDAGTRKGYYIWADSLESGTFDVPRPDMSIVLSEELPTLFELCEIFPKDYVFAVNPTKVRTIINRIVPPAIAPAKVAPKNRITWAEALQAKGNGTSGTYEATKGYKTLSKKSKAHKQYADGLHQLELLQKKALKKLPKDSRDEAARLITPIGALVFAPDEYEPKKAYKNHLLNAQLHENFQNTYGSSDFTAELLSANPRNELDALQAVLLPKLDQTLDDIESNLAKMPIAKKIELYKSYIAGFDADASNNPLIGLQATIAIKTSYTDLEKLASVAPGARFWMQYATPRLGFDVPDEYSAALNEIEDCFAASLTLHSQLEAAGESAFAGNVVLGGNFVQTIILLSGSNIRTIAKLSKDTKWALVLELHKLLSEQYPITTS